MVNGSGTPYASIAEAIAAAAPGDTIVIDGEFTENITLNSAISLSGDDPATDKIIGTGSGRVLYYSTNVGASFSVSNLTISGGSASGNGAGILIDKTDGTADLNNLIIENNTTSASGGGIGSNSSNVNLTDVIIENQSSQGGEFISQLTITQVRPMKTKLLISKGL